jgi:hypothetical protein
MILLRQAAETFPKRGWPPINADKKTARSSALIGVYQRLRIVFSVSHCASGDQHHRQQQLSQNLQQHLHAAFLSPRSA